MAYNYSSRQTDIEKRLALAKALQEQSIQGPGPTQMAGGMAVNQGMSNAITPLVQALLGNFTAKGAEKDKAKLDTERSAAAQDWMKKVSGLQTPGQLPDDQLSAVQVTADTSGASPELQQKVADTNARAYSDNEGSRQQQLLALALQGGDINDFTGALGQGMVQNELFTRPAQHAKTEAEMAKERREWMRDRSKLEFQERSADERQKTQLDATASEGEKTRSAADARQRASDAAAMAREVARQKPTTPEGLKKANQEYGKDFGDGTIVNQLRSKHEDIQDLDRVAVLVRSGKLDPSGLAALADAYAREKDSPGIITQTLKRYATTPSIQEANAIFSRMAPRARPAGSGSSSNLDVSMYLQGLGGAASSPEALLNITQTQKKKLEQGFKQDQARYDHFKKNNYNLEGFEAPVEEDADSSIAASPANTVPTAFDQFKRKK